MTNVVKEEQIKAMLNYKQTQSKSNAETILDALDKLEKPSSSTEIKQYLDNKAFSKAQEEAEAKYNNAEITYAEVQNYIDKNSKTMDLRTVQRWLSELVKRGFVERKYNRYSLTITGKRELQFRAFATSYGLIALNTLMNYHSPTRYTHEDNLMKLVEIFGMYVVYCLIEATRLIIAQNNNQEEHWHSSYFGSPLNFKNGNFKEAKLVKSWIKDIFSPWHMLNLFLTTVSNSRSIKNGTKSTYPKINNILQQIKEDEREGSLLRIRGIPIKSIVSKSTDIKKKAKRKLPPTTLDLMFRRISSSVRPFFANQQINLPEDIMEKTGTALDFFKIRSQYNEDHLLYELDAQQIEELKNILKKNYPLSYECLQMTDTIFYSKK